MTILKSVHFKTPIELARNFVICWKQNNRILCTQKVEMDTSFIIDHSMIVQLDEKEANELNLVDALGVIQGERNHD